MPNSATPVLVRRTEAEMDAYMAGQRQVLALVREKGLDDAERLIEAAQRTILERSYCQTGR
jgi:hypothetical protein